MSATSAVTDIRIGHINLRVTDLDRAVAFYRDVLGFRVTADAREVGVPMVLLAAGDYHHHVALNNFARAARDDRAAVPARNAAEAHLQSPAPRPARADESDVGLHHVAFLYPDRAALARAVQRVLEVGYPIDGAEDHGANVAVYLRDPDGNGLELYYDRPRAHWFDASGRLLLQLVRFDVRELLSAA